MTTVRYLRVGHRLPSVATAFVILLGSQSVASFSFPTRVTAKVGSLLRSESPSSSLYTPSLLPSPPVVRIRVVDNQDALLTTIVNLNRTFEDIIRVEEELEPIKVRSMRFIVEYLMGSMFDFDRQGKLLNHDETLQHILLSEFSNDLSVELAVKDVMDELELCHPLVVHKQQAIILILEKVNHIVETTACSTGTLEWCRGELWDVLALLQQAEDAANQRYRNIKNTYSLCEFPFYSRISWNANINNLYEQFWREGPTSIYAKIKKRAVESVIIEQQCGEIAWLLDKLESKLTTLRAPNVSDHDLIILSELDARFDRAKSYFRHILSERQRMEAHLDDAKMAIQSYVNKIPNLAPNAPIYWNDITHSWVLFSNRRRYKKVMTAARRLTDSMNRESEQTQLRLDHRLILSTRAQIRKDSLFVHLNFPDGFNLTKSSYEEGQILHLQRLMKVDQSIESLNRYVSTPIEQLENEVGCLYVPIRDELRDVADCM